MSASPPPKPEQLAELSAGVRRMPGLRFYWACIFTSALASGALAVILF
jgi:hypothetical protein